MKKIVSIIVPVYNASEHIDLCVNSIMNQTYKNLEIILVNDGSTDNSLAILKKFKALDDRIIVINKKNGGVASARNMGLKKSTGYYVMFMDNDDYMDEDFVENLIKLDTKKYDIINTGYVRETYDNKVLFKRVLENDAVAPYIQLASWGKLYRGEFIRDFTFLDSKIADDFYFNVLAYNQTKKIISTDYIGYHWMFNNKSISNTKNKGLADTDALLNVLEEIDKKLEKREEIVEYFYIRTVLYYLLFSCKRVSMKIILNEYNKMFDWLEKHDVKLNNKYIGITKHSSESLSVRMAIKMFLVLKRIHLIKLFFFLYSKV